MIEDNITISCQYIKTRLNMENLTNFDQKFRNLADFKTNPSNMAVCYKLRPQNLK